jgi:hypothetical protein
VISLGNRSKPAIPVFFHTDFSADYEQIMGFPLPLSSGQGGRSMPLSEKVASRRIANGDHRGVLQAPFCGNGIKLGADFVRHTQRAQALLLTDLLLHHRRHGKYARAAFAESP